MPHSSAPSSLSVPNSPTISATNHRRLSIRRRGSLSAPDPWGTFEEPERGVASVLHILKAPSPNPDEVETQAQKRRSGHLVAGSVGGASRISFAGTSPAPDGHGHAHSHSHSRRSSSIAHHTSTHASLTPTQIVEYAQECNHPSSNPPPNARAPSPVHFTPIPDSQFLPFIDRPTEVAELINSPSSRLLFLLMSQAIFTNPTPGDVLDPSTWNYAQLETWLTKTTRDESPDIEWVQKARACIKHRSELMWEKVKAALGVPPELDDTGKDVIGTGMPEGEEAEAVSLSDSEDDVWIEPIIATPSPSIRPFSPALPSPTVERHSLEDIREDEPVHKPKPPSPIGLRIVNAPSPPPTRRFSTPGMAMSPGSSGSVGGYFYDALNERGPGHPLFPSSFKGVSLGPTLRANNTRSPPIPPASRFSHSSGAATGGSGRRGGRVRSWAEGLDPSKQPEYAVSVGSASSVGR